MRRGCCHGVLAGVVGVDKAFDLNASEGDVVLPAQAESVRVGPLRRSWSSVAPCLHRDGNHVVARPCVCAGRL
eukprot:14976535-Alexandrium_andersonii.AAC.1